MIVPTWFVALYLRAARRNRTYISADGARREIARATGATAPSASPRVRSDVATRSTARHGWTVRRLTPVSGRVAGSVTYLHGGGWVHGIAPQHWSLAARIAADCRVAVDVPLYPLLPTGTAREAVDTVAELVRENQAELGPTVLAGDSAGGQIALSAALALRDAGTVLPATVLIAPALDLTWSNPRIPEVQPSDPWLGVPGGRVITDRWAGGLDLLDPAVSPLAGDLRGLGPLVVYTGTRDILNPDAALLRDRAREAGVTVAFHEEAGALHVDPLLPTRSGRTARDGIVDAVRSAVDGVDPTMLRTRP